MGTPDFDILIVGGGPAGLSTWLHLHALAPELAHRTALIEKARYPRDKLCGGGVTPLGDNLLRGLGITVSIPSVPIHNVEFRFGERTLPLRRPNAFRVVRRVEFDHAVAQAAVDRGLQLHEGETFQALQRVDGALIVRTSRGEYRVRTLIGADGAYSAVRKSMGLADDSRIARLIEIVTPVDAQQDREFATGTAVFDFSPVAAGLQGYVWHFPCLEDGAAAMNRGIYDSRVHQDRQRAELKGIFSRELEARQIVLRTLSWAGHPVRCFSAGSVFSQPNIALVGDAAGVDPALGEGIAPALDYGDFAANVLIGAFRTNDFALADYKSQLLAHPVGRSLAGRAQLAEAMYAGGPDTLRRVNQLVAGWLR